MFHISASEQVHLGVPNLSGGGNITCKWPDFSGFKPVNIRDLHTVYCEICRGNTEEHRHAEPNTDGLRWTEWQPPLEEVMGASVRSYMRKEGFCSRKMPLVPKHQRCAQSVDSGKDK